MSFFSGGLRADMKMLGRRLPESGACPWRQLPARIRSGRVAMPAIRGCAGKWTFRLLVSHVSVRPLVPVRVFPWGHKELESGTTSVRRCSSQATVVPAESKFSPILPEGRKNDLTSRNRGV